MLLKIGSNGEDVKKLQEKLGTTADGSFGPGTEKIVKEWQSKNGLTSDGIIGDSSWSKLFGSTTPVSNVVIPSSQFKLENLKGHIPDAVIAGVYKTPAGKKVLTEIIPKLKKAIGNPIQANLDALAETSDEIKASAYNDAVELLKGFVNNGNVELQGCTWLVRAKC